MSRLLPRKAVRDARRHRGQFVAVAATVALATCVFVAALAAYRNLGVSYTATYSRLRFADLVVSGPDAPRLAATARAVKGVLVTERAQAEIGIRLAGRHSLRGRIVGLPDDGARPAVDRPLLLSGTWPQTGEVLAETHLADRWRLRPGSTVELARTDGSWSTARVAGTVASPEYLYPARSRQELVTTPEDFGVVFATNALARQLAGAGAVPQTAMYVPDRSRAAAVTEDLEARATRLDLTDVMTRATHPSARALEDDIDGIGTMAVFFPLLFLVAGALATWVMLGRLVTAQRAVIGTLLASGLPRRRLLLHYLSFGVVTAFGGALVGAAGGQLLGGWITRTYTRSLGLPLTVNRLQPAVIVAAIGVAAIVGVVAAAGPARAAMRMPPAEAMRASTPGGHGRPSLAERLLPPLRRLPARWAMVLRNIGRNPRRSVSTVGGVALAVALVLTMWGLLDTVNILLPRQFGDVQREDAQVDVTPAAAVTTLTAIRGVRGVATVEPAVRLPVSLANGARRYSTLLVALPADTRMHAFHVVGGGERRLPDRGLLLGRSLRGLLDLNVGDTVTASVDVAGITVRERVAGFVDEPFGSVAYLNLDRVSQLAGRSVVTAAFVRLAPGADRIDVRAAISRLPGVTGYTDVRALHASISRQMSLFYALVGMMLLFAALLAAALCFNAMSANVAERSGELAALRVAGMPRRMLRRVVSVENLALAALGLPFGVAAGILLGRAFLASYTSDIYRWPLHLYWWTPFAAAACVFAAAALAELPALRSVERIELGRVVRERSL